ETLKKESVSAREIQLRQEHEQTKQQLATLNKDIKTQIQHGTTFEEATKDAKPGEVRRLYDQSGGSIDIKFDAHGKPETATYKLPSAQGMQPLSGTLKITDESHTKLLTNLTASG